MSQPNKTIDDTRSSQPLHQLARAHQLAYIHDGEAARCSCGGWSIRGLFNEHDRHAAHEIWMYHRNHHHNNNNSNPTATAVTEREI